MKVPLMMGSMSMLIWANKEAFFSQKKLKTPQLPTAEANNTTCNKARQKTAYRTDIRNQENVGSAAGQGRAPDKCKSKRCPAAEELRLQKGRLETQKHQALNPNKRIAPHQTLDKNPPV
jgi:hypothetical protein